MTEKRDRRTALVWLPVLLVAVGSAVIVWLLIPLRITFRQAFLASMGLAVAALALLVALRRGPWWPRPILSTRGERIGFLLVVAVGALMRVASFDAFPPADGQLNEEAQMGAGAYASWHAGDLDAFFPLTTLTAEVGFRLFGVSLRTLRLPFVALGVLSVPLFFVAARLFFSSPAAALFAAGLFATNAFLAGSSRIALESMAPIFTTCLALAALFYACVRRDATSAALAGLANGLVFLEYFSYKLVPVPAAFLLLARWLQGGDAPYCNAAGPPYRWANLRQARREVLSGAVFAAAALAAMLASDQGNFAPILEGFLRHRTAMESEVLPISAVLANAIERVAQSASYVFGGSGGAYDILPASMGLLDPVTGWFGVAALAWCVVSGRRNPAKRFLVLATALFVVLGGVLTSQPTRYRLIPLIPYCCLAAGVIVDDLVEHLPRHRMAIGLASAALLAALGAFNANRFFGIAMHDPGVLASFNDLDAAIGLELGVLQQRDPGAVVYLLSDRSFFGTVNDYYFLYDPNLVKVVATPAELAGARGYLLTHEPFLATAETIAGLRACRQWRPRAGPIALMECRLPAE